MRGTMSTFEWSTIRQMEELKPFWCDANELYVGGRNYQQFQRYVGWVIMNELIYS